MAKKASTAEPVEEQPELQEVVDPPAQQEENGNKLVVDDEGNQRREQRKSEWGTQCDRWLIRCQQKGKAVLLYLGEFDPSNKESGVKAVPKRIDQHFVQFDFGEGREVWVGKAFIAGIEGGQIAE